MIGMLRDRFGEWVTDFTDCPRYASKANPFPRETSGIRQPIGSQKSPANFQPRPTGRSEIATFERGGERSVTTAKIVRASRSAKYFADQALEARWGRLRNLRS
jgi:hypothetical protein